jgi:mTERF domain-containing protein, mitochondrial
LRWWRTSQILFSVEREALSSSMMLTPTSSNKQKAIARITTTSGGALLELVLFLLELGMDHEEIKNIVRKFPAFAYLC